MANFTLFVAGDPSNAVEMRSRLDEVGVVLGYGARGGKTAGRGAAGLMLRDIAEGKCAVVPEGKPGDFAWLAGVLERLIADNPDRLELLRSGIAACEEATRQRARGPIGGEDRGGRFELAEE
jgi:hypothetical protein